MAEKVLTPEEEINALKERLAKAEADKADAAAQLKQVAADKEAQAKQLAAAEAEKAEQAALLDEQNERLALAEAQKGKKLPVVQDSKKKKYQVLAAKFHHPETNEVVKAEELASDKKLVDLLVEKKSGLLAAYVEPSK